jgi:peptidoglycan/xylan/chitin deacetylase (PgdA/CDA1 family)
VVVKRGLESGEAEPVAAGPGGGPPAVALTFDDGPHPRWTPLILDVLKAKGVKATFFDLGLMASRYPDLVRREVAEGMSVQNHSWNHPRLAGRLAPFVNAQLVRTRDLLNSLGAHVTAFRPPYASYDASTISVASAAGMRTVVWSEDPSDYRKPPASVIVARVMGAVRPGAIVLMHDGGGDRSQTLAALPVIIDQLRARGFTFATIT